MVSDRFIFNITGKCIVKFLIIVNESPWGSGLTLCALRFARAVIARGGEISAVFFREEGVYNAIAHTASDGATENLAEAWENFSERHGSRLLLCSSSRQRRLPETFAAGRFKDSGLAEMLELMQESDRVISL
jgi:tRNA 2-thiouridine synthesizing protein D